MKQTCGHQFVRQKRFVHEEVRMRVGPIVLEIKVNYSIHLVLSGYLKIIGIIFSILLQLLTLRLLYMEMF